MNAVYITRTTEIAARVLDGEMMIMCARDSSLFSLNEVATAIWQAADGQTPLANIVENKICAEFDVPPDQAQRDAEEFVRDLSSHGVLIVSDQPIAPSAPGPPE